MIKRYDNHKEELNELKNIIINYDKKVYDEVFKCKQPKIKNYYNYIHKPKEVKVKDFYDYLKEKLEKIDDKRIELIFDKMEKDLYLLKQNDSSNGEIPYQLNLIEMQAIIDNQSVYYPELRKKDLTKILTFRIPYYYGPLDGNIKFGWLIKKENELLTRIDPWNHEQVVDVDRTASNFIEKLTNYCTYLPDKKVMSKYSLTCCRYEVLAELNKIRVNGRKIPVNIKKRIINDVFMKTKKVTEKHLRDWYKKHFIELNNETIEFKGFQKEHAFSSSLKS